MAQCNICKHEMHRHGLHQDCGGDCLLCMSTIADDPTCVQAVANLAKKYHDQLELLKKNLYRGMSASIQRMQARAIEEVLMEDGWPKETP